MVVFPGFLCILISPVGTDATKPCWRNMLAGAAAAFDAVEHKSQRKVVKGCNKNTVGKVFKKVLLNFLEDCGVV